MDRLPTTLPEDLLLLCARGEYAMLQLPGFAGLALAGAAVAELLLTGRAVLEGDRVRLLALAPCGQPSTDLTVRALSQQVGTFYGTPLRVALSRLGPLIVRPILNSLVHRGVVYPKERKQLLLRTTCYHAYEHSLLALCAADLRRAVADPLAPARTRALAAFAHAGRITPWHYRNQPPKQRQYTQVRLARLLAADPVALVAAALIREEVAREAARRAANY